ncbi:nucleolar complex protein 14 [Coemansia biformis]|uniref:Nucleolar complex protein 14 n=1 Tax=Coemansia biformis TaxID=1286918 RepID=A0A9W7YE65_9FUNG|nr:nucleolar complex protein 14 [Coemansia biformis]
MTGPFACDLPAAVAPAAEDTAKDAADLAPSRGDHPLNEAGHGNGHNPHDELSQSNMGTHNAVKRSTGGKQSSLKKLRTALSKAGITGPKANTSKRAKQRVQKDAKDERRVKLQGIQSALNPYELQMNRKKLDILGLKRRDDVVNVAQARQRAVERRKETLGKEREQKGKRGGIVDQRIGENDASMDPEERMLKRFTVERQKRGSSGGLFNLEDSDVEEGIVSLTHFGRTLDEIDNLNDMVGSDYDDDNGPAGNIEASEVSSSHFGGFGTGNDGEPARKKSKAEVMQEIIAKSKQYKHERQMLKEQDDGVRRELDDDFESVRALLFANKDKTAASILPKDEHDETYDAHVRNLAFEKRARPQDRLKTEAEKARAEMERLERAERHRIRRMDGLPSDSESDGDDSDADMPGYKASNKRRPEADDLGDDFGAAPDSGEADSHVAGVSLGAGLGVRGAADDSGSEEEDGSDDDDGSEEEDGSDGDDGSGDDDGSDLEESADEQPRGAGSKASAAARAASGKSGSAITAPGDELPYTFAAPADYDAWVELAGGYSVDQQLVVVRRLRTLYHIRLAPQNKEKLAALAVILVEHVAVLSAQEPPVTGASIDELTKHIGELADVDAERFGEHCRQEIIGIHGRIVAGIRASSGDITKPGSEGLRASDLVLMRMFVSLFSSSDRYHSVITPMLVAMGQHLSQYTFATLGDVASGLILVGIAHEAQRLSRRLMPETVNYVFSVLAAAVCSPNDAADWAGPFPLSRRQREAFAALRIGASDKCSDPAKAFGVPWAWATSAAAKLTADEKYSILRAALMLARRLADCYFALPAFVELFAPLELLVAKVSDRLPQFKLHQAPPAVTKEVTGLREHLTEQLQQAQASRVPLKLQHHRPLAIASVAPRFESNYSLDVHYDPDRARGETTKLRRQLGRERRGAVRELRRDAQFIATERLHDQLEKDKQYAAKMKKAWSVLETDQSEMKKMDKLRIKERKRKI